MPEPQRLSFRQSLLLGSLLFGLFFGAGNLIFPISLGLQAGSAVGSAALGFLVAAVGLPILGVVASALSRTSSVHELASRVAPWFGVAFTVALYLTIGPFFAIPRTATVSFEMAFGHLDGTPERVVLLLFSAAFFAATLYASMHPGRLLDYVGRYLTPTFLVLLGILLVVALASPAPAAPAPLGEYATHAATQGVLDGYNTMDALASLAFAIVIVQAARGLGVTTPGRIAFEVGRAGIWAAIAMGVIYAALAVLGSRAFELVPRDANGALGLAAIAQHHFAGVGHLLAAAIMLVACLKTAIGLVTSCAEMFERMVPVPLSQRGWAIAFSAVSFVLANVGLDAIIAGAIPVLLFLYPLAITLIALGLLDRWVHDRPWAYRLSLLAAGVASGLALLPGGARIAGAWLPGFELGFGWLVPAVIGLVVGCVLPQSAVRVPERVR